MLKRLIILNSDTYSKADIEFDDCDSIQIVGPNNIGKSTLVYALNFLFIIDGREMTFSGGRAGDKATINHYFPSINSSFIIFEIFKNRYYSILIRKNVDGNLDYYKIESEYREECYFMATDNGQQLRKFDSVITEFTTKGIRHSKFSHRRDVFNFIYQKGKSNNAVVWLDKNVNQDGRGTSNNFSKIYKYLINSKLINNDSLKESLIIADNRESEKVVFSKKNQKDIQTLLKHNRDIKTIKDIEQDFLKFKELLNSYTGINSHLSELIFVFNHQYSLLHSNLDTSELELEKSKKIEERDKVLDPRKSKLNNQIGRLDNQIEQNQEEFTKKSVLIDEIKQYEPLKFLESAFNNLDVKRKKIESQLTLIENQDLNSVEIENKILTATEEIKKINSRVKNYSNQLIHQISDNQKNKELLNEILTKDITSLSAENISKKINQVGTLMNLFDGVINLPDNLRGKPIESIKELKEQVTQLEKGKEHNKALLPIAKNLEKYKKDLANIEENKQTVSNKIEKTKQLPQLEKGCAKLAEECINEEEFLEKTLNANTLPQKRRKTRLEISAIEGKIKSINKIIDELTEEIGNKQIELKKIEGWKLELEDYNIKPTKYQTEDSLDNIYSKIKQNLKQQQAVKFNKDNLFAELKSKTETIFANEIDFIKYLESEILALSDKQKAIDGLLSNISTQFSTPCGTILSRFSEFNTFISNKFNKRIGKIKISDVDTLKVEIIKNEKLINDLQEITQISSGSIFNDQSKSLDILNKYLDDRSTINFNDLFDIKLHLHKKGKHKIVDLKNQVESDGTDKIIRLVIIMSIINQIVINDSENKIVLFIDEVGTLDEANRIEILKFCKEYNFVPIFAAPLHPYDGFDKYYLLIRDENKIIVSKNNCILRKYSNSKT